VYQVKNLYFFQLFVARQKVLVKMFLVTSFGSKIESSSRY